MLDAWEKEETPRNLYITEVLYNHIVYNHILSDYLFLRKLLINQEEQNSTSELHTAHFGHNWMKKASVLKTKIESKGLNYCLIGDTAAQERSAWSRMDGFRKNKSG